MSGENLERHIASMVEQVTGLQVMHRDLGRMVADLTGAIADLSRIHGITTEPGEGRDRETKYPWGDLDTVGRFFVAGATKHDRQRLVRSLSAVGNKRFGAGYIRTKQGRDGVWVIRKG